MKNTLYTRRLVLIAVLSTGISVIFMLGLMVNGVVNQTADIVTELTASGMGSKAGLGCRYNPKIWGMTTNNGSKLYTYDLRTLHSMNPSAPAIPKTLVEKIRQGAWHTHSRFPLIRGGGILMVKLAEKGPCSLLFVQWRVSPFTRFRRMGALFLVFVLGLSMCLTMAYYGIVKPMLLRIEALAQIARNVGQKESLFQTTSVQRDDLRMIEEGLQLANQQIMLDKQRLAAKNQALSQHLADVAHDLRTPIASLQLALERLMQRQKESPQEELSIALADTVYLEHLTNNLSLATRLQEGLIPAEDRPPLDLRLVVERVAGRLRLLARDKGVSLDYACPDGPVCVPGQETLYERMLSNLVHNAVRYGNKGGHVVILLEVAGDSFTLQVMDDGPGVPPSEIPRLQGRMYRSNEARQRDSTGQGLGLAITHEICEILELSLQFSTVEPKGLCVTLQGQQTSHQCS
ncbi:MAG: HAMP domain-containing histidine kinase [Deltaproteobacteria bacterium]|nr:MAG: HAMP domain-containing histidine kinase [Deltaproteobacteria bacterium]